VSSTCDVCAGAVPDGKERPSHTALCAEIVRESLERSTTERECLRRTLQRLADGWRARSLDLRHNGLVEKEAMADAIDRCAKELERIALQPGPLVAATPKGCDEERR
jgi:hypothetical protein